MALSWVGLLLIIAAALTLFYTQRLRSDLTALLVLLSLVVPWMPGERGLEAILEPAEAFSGFGSPALVMVAAMFVVSAGMVRTGAAELLGRRLLERAASSERRLQLTVLTVVTLFSTVVNDTAAALVWMPVVIGVCRARGYSPSRYLLLVAYGALLGGQWTLIGTRSNLIVSDYLASHSGAGLDFFEFTPVAAAVFAACALFFLLVGWRFMPGAPADQDLTEIYRVTEFLTEVMVAARAGVTGKTLDEARLKQTYGVDIIEVVRGESRLPPSGWLRIEPGDVLVVQGGSAHIARLLKAPYFQIREELKVAAGTLRSVDLMMVEAIVPRNSRLVGRRLGDVDFLAEFGLSLMAVAREAQSDDARPADTVLRFGDTLLLYGHPGTVNGLRRHPDLKPVESQPFPILERFRAVLMIGILALALLAGGFRLLPPAVAIPLAAAATVLSGCLRVREIYESIDWAAIVVVGGMIPFGLALEKTGAAAALGALVARSFLGQSPALLVGAIVLLAVASTQLIENAAVAVILSPVVYSVAAGAGLNPRPAMMALAIAVSAAFMTPIAHEVTVLVQGPGRYRFGHYLKVGSGFALITWLVTWAGVLLLYGLLGS